MDKSECLELKNIKYQTMLLNGNSQLVSTQENSVDIDKILEKEKVSNRSKAWSKLGKASKLRKLNQYVNTYAQEHKLSKSDKLTLKQYLLICLDRKKLNRVKDIIYDVQTGKIKEIPGLSFNKTTSKFTLKRVDKKNSTLKGLAPKRIRKPRKRSKIDIHLKDKS